MADKISQLPAAAALTGTEQIPMVQGGATVRATPKSFFQPSMRNLLINAAQLINQRAYVSGTATTAANQYTIDRWKVVTSGQNVSWAVDANGIPTFTVPAGGWAQVIEGSNLRGGTYVLSWIGTATATINGTAVANGATINLTGGANATVVFSNGTLSLPQLELGSMPTVFDFRPALIESLACRRYYQTFASMRQIGYVGGANAFSTGLTWIPMRAFPSYIFTITSSSNVNVGASNFTIVGPNGGYTFIIGSAAGNCDATYNLILDAEL